MRRSGGGGETKDDKGMTKNDSAYSTTGGDSSGGATVDQLRLEELSSVKISLGNKKTLGLVKR